MIKIRRIKCKLTLKEIREKVLIYPYNFKNDKTSENLTVVFAKAYQKKKLHKKYLLEEYPGDNKYRGYHVGDTIVIFIENFYTIDVIKWLFIHEIVHYELRRTSAIDTFMRMEGYKYIKSVEKKTGKRWNFEMYLNDKIHDNVPEEKFCDQIATKLVGKNYGRKYWRKGLKNNK